jgi:DNA-binding MarR family transcriptional regulator
VRGSARATSHSPPPLPGEVGRGNRPTGGARSAASPHPGLPPRAGEGARSGFVLDDHVFYLFTQIFGRRNRALAAGLRPFGVTVAKWRVLAVLDHSPGATMGALAHLTSVDRTTLTRTLDQLAKDGLVDRKADERDRRLLRLALTPGGAALFRRILPIVEEQNARALEGLSGAELDQLRAQLRRMIANLDD